LARLTSRFFDPRAGFLAALALNATSFYGVMIGTLAEPDGPLLFFWLLTLDRLAVALEDPRRTSAWIGVGLAWGATLLSKYHAVLIPAGLLMYLILRPAARRCLLMPGPYLAVAAGLIAFSPVIIWNSRHGWASFLYQGNRASGFRGIQPDMFLEALIGQILYMTPWIWLALLVVVFRLMRKGPWRWSDAEAFLLCQALPALGLFMGISTFRRIMPHWPLIGFVALLPMLGQAWSARLDLRPVRMRRALALITVAPILLGILFVVHARTGLFQDSRGRLLGLIPAHVDPTVDTIRWDQIAQELKRTGVLDRPSTFVFTDSWRFSSELAMSLDQNVPVACFHRDSRSFTFWSDPEDWVGRDAIFIRVHDGLTDAENYAPWFERVEPFETFPILRAGAPMEKVRIYRCVHQLAPFPFGYCGPGPIPRPNLSPQTAQKPREASRN
jgi:4-amino-4-deoxy-L-arabinose transferase-like glycosyltransferase